QLLGTRLADPDGVEGDTAEAPGLALLDVETDFTADKATRKVTGQVAAHAGFFGCASDLCLAGYEIHVGRTTGPAAPFAHLRPDAHGPVLLGGDGRDSAPPFPRGEGGLGELGPPDGAVSPDGLVAGTYLHGLFHNVAL